MSLDGILNIFKPGGKTSAEVVSQVRRLSSERRVGHAGTLDPEATGVLVVGLGQGTRIIKFLADASKAYYAEIELGITTDTYDASGKVIQRHDPSFVTREQVEKALDSFRGTIEQIPPMYSAARCKGRRLYQLARLGIEVPREAKKVHILHLELVNWQPPVITVKVECSTGTYIRSLAQDIGQNLGCGAYLRKLIRLRCGCFSIEDAVTLPVLEEASLLGGWQNFLYPIDEVLLEWKAAIVGEENEYAIRNGRPLHLEGDKNGFEGEQCRAYSTHGCFLAILTFQAEGGLWHPDRVFSPRRES